jgi:predicted porin
MKKSLLALAVLGAFAGVASAQSTVTIYGQVDAALGKSIGSEDKEVMDPSDSRIGFRGTEDLGGGLKGLFNIEHRFDSGTGSYADIGNGQRFWHGIAMVGLGGGFGTVGLGRLYQASWIVTNQIDPWGDDTVAGLRSVGILPEVTIVENDDGDQLVGLQDSNDKRSDNAIRYDSPSLGGFTFAASMAEGRSGSTDERPWSVGAVYAAGPLWLGVAYQQTRDEDSDLITVGAKYKFGAFGVNAGYSTGSGVAGEDLTSYLVAGTYQLGAGELRVGYAEAQEDLSDSKYKKAGIGYHYALSKRTKIYADFARGSSSLAGGDDEKSGYDFGLQHKF